MTRLPFAKYHGLGNDFLIVDLRTENRPTLQTAATARRLCDRKFGVGGDGVLVVLPPASDGTDCRMRVLNADGSEAEMCGNGIRCVAKALVERDPALRGRDVLRIDTLAGIMDCGITRGPDGQVTEVAVAMGRPRLERAEIPMSGAPASRCLEELVPGTELAITAVSMGNPHAIAFVSETGAALRRRAEQQGPAIETHPWFPQRTNVEFAHLLTEGDETVIELVVWERGCGITLACGTGASATAVAACLTGRAQRDRPLRVRLLGGELLITVAPNDQSVTMRGPATHVYDGFIDI